MMHDLKTWPVFFTAIEAGRKTFEYRRNDRNFQTGHHVRLMEYNPVTNTYSGRSQVFQIGYLLGHQECPDIPYGFCVFVLQKLEVANLPPPPSEREPVEQELPREPQRKNYPIGTKVRATLIHETAVSQIVEDEHGTTHRIDGAQRDLRAKHGDSGWLEYMETAEGAVFRFTVDAR